MRRPREFEGSYQALFESVNDAIFIIDRERIVHCNGMTLTMFGFETRADVVGHSPWDFSPAMQPDGRHSRDKFLEAIHEALKGTPQRFSWMHHRKDGTPFDAEVSLSPVTSGKKVLIQTIVRDISTRTQAEEALREKELEIDRFFANALDLLCIADTDGYFRRVNREWETTLGYPTAELEGKRFLDYVHPDDIDGTLNAMSDLGRQKEVLNFVNRYRHKNGSYRWIEWRSFPAGKLIYAAARDITERKENEEVLEMFRFTVDQASDEVVWIKKDARFDYVNDQACRMLGYTRDELMQLSLFDIDPYFPQKRWEDDWKNFQRGRQGGTVIVESFQRRKSGELFPVDVTAKHLWFGERELHVAVVRDITERKRAEEALQNSEELYRTIFRNTGTATVLIAEDTTISLANPQFETLSKYSKKDIEGKKSWTEFVHKDDLDMMRAQHRLRREHQDAALKKYVFRFVAGDGTTRNILLTIDVIPGTTKSVASLLDITDREQAEAQIRLLNQELEERVRERTTQLEAANKELEAFAYSVSHDLRAPLRAIDGYARILIEDYQPSLDSEGERVCAVIHEETRRMGHLIDDLLAFSRIGRSHMVHAEIDVAAMANAVFHDLAIPDARSKIDFRIREVPNASGDPGLMRQVWTNLLSNAIKFTSKREKPVIEVRGEISGDEIVYSVTDNGAGFDMQYAGKLFGVFQRLHSTKDFEGTGVGLAIVQRIVHRHGGRLWAEGRPDHGATFYFTVPLKGA